MTETRAQSTQPLASVVTPVAGQSTKTLPVSLWDWQCLFVLSLHCVGWGNRTAHWLVTADQHTKRRPEVEDPAKVRPLRRSLVLRPNPHSLEQIQWEIVDWSLGLLSDGTARTWDEAYYLARASWLRILEHEALDQAQRAKENNK